MQNGFQVTFESLLNHFSAFQPPDHNGILLKAEIAGAGRGSKDIEVSIEISVPGTALFAEKIDSVGEFGF